MYILEFYIPSIPSRALVIYSGSWSGSKFCSVQPRDMDGIQTFKVSFKVNGDAANYFFGFVSTKNKRWSGRYHIKPSALFTGSGGVISSADFKTTGNVVMKKNKNQEYVILLQINMDKGRGYIWDGNIWSDRHKYLECDFRNEKVGIVVGFAGNDRKQMTILQSVRLQLYKSLFLLDLPRNVCFCEI